MTREQRWSETPRLLPITPDPHPLAMLRGAGRHSLPLGITEHVNKAELPFLPTPLFFKQQPKKKKSEANTEFPEGKRRREYVKSTFNVSTDWQLGRCGLRLNAKLSLPLPEFLRPAV